MDGKTRVLIGSPVRQNREILEHFLWGIRKLDLHNIDADYIFIDDNTDDGSFKLLESFEAELPNTKIIEAKDENQYICSEKTHVWEEELIWKVAGFKNLIIEKAIDGGYDHLFLVDADIVLHPRTLAHLVSLEKDIVSEIFWTRWEPDFPELPQVWAADQYTLYNCSRGENLTQQEIIKRMQAFLSQLRVPGVYPVGGLGACTLISRKALLKVVN